MYLSYKLVQENLDVWNFIFPFLKRSKCDLGNIYVLNQKMKVNFQVNILLKSRFHYNGKIKPCKGRSFAWSNWGKKPSMLCHFVKNDSALRYKMTQSQVYFHFSTTF